MAGSTRVSFSLAETRSAPCATISRVLAPQRCPQTCGAKTREIVAQGADRVSASEKLTRVDPAIARLIDHTLLRPDATRAEIVKICAEARKYQFASVCVNPYWVPVVAA